MRALGRWGHWRPALGLVMTLFLFGASVSASQERKVTLERPQEIITAVNAQVRAASQKQSFTLVTTERSGRSLRRSFVSMRADDPGASEQRTTRRSVAAIVAPRLLQGTKLLTWDYSDQRDDDQWLFTRADRRTRRISASSRGDAFFGSAFSYDDMKSAQRMDTDSYLWERLPDAGAKAGTSSEVVCDQPRCFVLEYRPKTPKLAKALGYNRAVMVVDAERLVGLHWDFYDVRDELYKSITASDIRLVDGIWTTHRFVAQLLRSKRQTEIVIESVNYGVAVDPALLQREGLERDLP